MVASWLAGRAAGDRRLAVALRSGTSIGGGASPLARVAQRRVYRDAKRLAWAAISTPTSRFQALKSTSWIGPGLPPPTGLPLNRVTGITESEVPVSRISSAPDKSAGNKVRSL